MPWTTIDRVMLYVKDTQRCMKFWTEEIGFLCESSMEGPDGTPAFVIRPSRDAQTALVLLDRDSVAKYSPELDLAVPSLMFLCDDVAAMREYLARNGVTVGDIVQMGESVTCNFADPEQHYFAFSQK